VKALLAWRILTHEKGRSGLAISGILVAILLMFLQLGIYSSVPKGGLLFYDAMRFDLMLASSNYVFQAQSSSFPRRRLYQALSVPEVAEAIPVYHNSGRWLNDDSRLIRDVFMIGIRPGDAVFRRPELFGQLDAILRQPDTVLIDTLSRPEFGRLAFGRRIEIEERSVRIGGTYSLGIGFVGLGVAIASDINFLRIFPTTSLANINLGLITLRPEADPDSVARRLRQIMLADTQVFTRKELTESESSHWLTRTSTGLIFGFGVIVAVIVGLVILNQTLATQINRQLPQYATLKAMGYTNRYLAGVVVSLAVMITSISYVPAALLSVLIYWSVRSATKLPIEMTTGRLLGVLATVWAMSAASALLATRALRRADPVELF
jgi:putative ABC transport system permease protein